MSKIGMRSIGIIVCLALLSGLIGLLAKPADVAAAVTRVAVIKELSGEVTVKKAGGAKPFKAFKNMSLNEGDAVTTGKGASLVLELADSKAKQDTVTIGENAQVNFSKLADDGGSKAKMNVWAGSLWVKVKSISNADDQFEIETPTAIMGVRGTLFGISVQPGSGTTSLFVSSGVVQTRNGIGSKPEPKLVYPAQQGVFAETSPGQVESKVSYIDPAQFVGQMTNEQVLMILQNASDIAEENGALKEQLASSLLDQLPGVDEGDLDRYVRNLDKLLAVIMREAINANKITSEQVDDIIRQLTDQGRPPGIDLDAGQFELSEAERQAQRQAELLKRKAQQQKEVREKTREARDDILSALKEEAERLKRQNEEMLERKKQEAIDRYTDQLTSEQRERFLQERENRRTESNTPTTSPTSPTSPVNSGGSRGADPSVTLSPGRSSLINPAAGEEVLLNVNFARFNNVSEHIYGYQLAIAYAPELAFDEQAFDDRSKPYRTAGPFKVEPEDGWPVNAPEAVDHYYTSSRTADGRTIPVLNYAVVKFAGDPVAIDGTSTVVTLPFKLIEQPEASQTLRFDLEVKAVDRQGNEIARISATGATLNLIK